VARLAFLGSPEVAAVTLQALLEAGHDVAVVVTGPDRRRGRGPALTPTPVKRLALERGIPVGDRLEDAVGAELGVVVAFGRLVPERLLDQLDFVNVHFSLLPRWRGAAPVERAILAGDEQTGVSLMKLEAGLDTGPVYASRATPIGPHETAAELRERLGVLGSALLVERLSRGLESLGEPVPQDPDVEPTYAAKLDPRELELDWSRSAVELERLVRVGRAWTTVAGRRLIVWRAIAGPSLGQVPPGGLVGRRVAAGEGSLELVEVQPEGRGRMPAEDWTRGARLGDGVRLG